MTKKYKKKYTKKGIEKGIKMVNFKKYQINTKEFFYTRPRNQKLQNVQKTNRKMVEVLPYQ